MHEQVDYEQLGFRCGLEIHYQLDTKKKLFCNCPVGLRKERHDAEIVRHMRPTLSELGEYDGTALMEFKTRKEVHYQLYYDTVCTYEMDDTPPFLLNGEALEIALEIALLLNCQIADEIHVSRKQYLDGSIPTGFQRTIAVGVNGWVPFKGREIRVLQLCLEEDACREISDSGHVIVFRTDRLSTPLVEVITAADMRTPDEAVEVDREIGRILRSTGKVRRGIGTVRQDVNVSISGGTRIEIKGVPRTGLIRSLVHHEAVRQHALLSLRRVLATRGISADTLRSESTICTELFRATETLPISKAVMEGGVVGAVKLCGFAGLLVFPVSQNRLFADEIRGRVRVIACLDTPPILYHSDLPREFSHISCPTEEEWKEVRERLDAHYPDSVLLVWGNAKDVATAMSEIVIRAREAAQGVPSETRQVLKEGQTDFERILPGPDRMYPDTDSAPIPIHEKAIRELKEQLPRTPGEWRSVYGGILSGELIDQLMDQGVMELFDRIYTETESDPALIATTLVSTLKALNRKNAVSERIGTDLLIDLFSHYKNGRCPRDAIPKILQTASRGEKSVSEILEDEISVATENEVRDTARELLMTDGYLASSGVLEKDPEKRMNFFIGQVKRRLGKEVDWLCVRKIFEEFADGE
jgi:glutamyl-tRNA(Gln) amidotransferase subunit E